MAQNLVIWALMYLGELGEVSRRVPALLADARSSGNLYLATELCTRSNYVWLAADDPDEGERVTHREHRPMVAQRISPAALQRACWPVYRPRSIAATPMRRGGCCGELESASFDIRISRASRSCGSSRSICARAARWRWPPRHGAHRRFLSVARAAARRIARERMPWSDPIALLHQGRRLRTSRAERRLALGYLHDAVDRFDRADMKLYAAVARRRIGALQDDARGRELQRQADEWMAAQDIKNPAAMTRTLAPGFPDLR